MLYGTWNHIQSVNFIVEERTKLFNGDELLFYIYERNDTLPDFLSQTLTPIVNYVLNQHRSLTNLFSIIEYTPLKRVCIDEFVCHDRSNYLRNMSRVINECYWIANIYWQI